MAPGAPLDDDVVAVRGGDVRVRGRTLARLLFFFEVNWLHWLDQATTNLLHKKIRREDGATCYDTHPTALFP